MSKKQIAALVATVLTAVAAALMQCPDATPAPEGVTATDAGAP